jgi:MarR family transcriptional repressor of emrRAB
MGIDNSTATRVSQVLIRRGWIKKQTFEKDKRVVLIKLTEEGESIQKRIEDKISDFGINVAESIPLEDRDEIKESLTYFHWKISKMLAKTV